MHFTAWITPRDGIAKRYALISFDPADARAEARLLGLSLFGAGFTYSVRPA